MIDIETYNPATITFPPEIHSLMIVNNAVQQPDNIGHYLDKENFSSDMSVSSDSMAYILCVSLGNAIAASTSFEDVRLYDEPLRRDSLFFMSQPLTAYKVASLCDENEVDALVSLDKIFYKTVIYNNHLYTGFISVEIFGEVSMFYPGGAEIITIPFVDSIKLMSDYNFLDVVTNGVFTAEDVNLTMRFISEYVGENLSNHFIPYWMNDQRWFYTSISSGWKRASVFAVAEKWEAAAKEWRYLYDMESKWKQKAFLASNLALCHELKGDFANAIEYAEKAFSLINEHSDEENQYRKMQSNYLELLKIRLEDDKKLSEQLREK